MKVEKVKVVDLKPAEYNPRQMTEKQANDLRDSIKKFGIVDPIIVNQSSDRYNIVIGGHQRLNICKELGMEEVPVTYVNLNEQDEKELNLRLNKNLGEWNFDMLANIGEDLLMKAGWDENDMEKMLGDIDDDKMLSSGSGNDDDPDKVVKLVFFLPKSKADEVMLQLKEADKDKSKALYKCITFKDE